MCVAVLVLNESDICCGVLEFGKMQVEEARGIDREHDGDEIVLPGESGYSGDSGWDNLEEDIEKEDGGTEVCDRDSSGEGDEQQGGNVVTPRNKKARIELANELDAALRASGDSDKESDDDNQGVKFGF